jgi:hypothetical protein
MILNTSFSTDPSPHFISKTYLLKVLISTNQLLLWRIIFPYLLSVHYLLQVYQQLQIIKWFLNFLGMWTFCIILIDSHVHSLFSLTVNYILRLFVLLRFYTHSLTLTLTHVLLDFSIPSLFAQARNILFHTCVLVTWRSLLGCNASAQFTNNTVNIHISEKFKDLKKELFRHSRTSNNFKMTDLRLY